MATIVSELSALGATVEPTADGLVVKGGAGSACGAARSGPTATTGWRWPWRWRPWPPRATPSIDGWDAVATSYPGFEDDLRRCV